MWNRGLRSELLPHVLVDQPLAGSHADPRAVQCLGMHRIDPLAGLLADAGMPAAATQPPPVGAADDPKALVGCGQALKGLLAHLPKPEHARLVPAKASKLGHLGTSSLPKRGDRRVVGGMWLARQRLPRSPLRNPCLCLQQVRDPQSQLLLPGRGEVLHNRRLAILRRRRTPIRPVGAAAAGMVDQPSDGCLPPLTIRAAQQHPSMVGLDRLDLPRRRAQARRQAPGSMPPAQPGPSPRPRS